VAVLPKHTVKRSRRCCQTR